MMNTMITRKARFDLLSERKKRHYQFREFDVRRLPLDKKKIF